mmetsp:Transcript_10875/g.18253  ORF Transcript_10875/g.18253 Transcript_10875/m.18253 type:complete len:118 (-) Transcript_10875:583-936(-)
MVFLNYSSILFFLFLAIVIAVIVFAVPYAFAAKVGDKEKLSSYECGFNPFEDSRGEFDVKFYLVAILFIIFDLEISLLFPLVLCLDQVGTSGVFSVFFFLIILTVGFLYEWKMGALD